MVHDIAAIPRGDVIVIYQEVQMNAFKAFEAA